MYTRLIFLRLRGPCRLRLVLPEMRSFVTPQERWVLSCDAQTSVQQRESWRGSKRRRCSRQRGDCLVRYLWEGDSYGKERYLSFLSSSLSPFPVYHCQRPDCGISSHDSKKCIAMAQASPCPHPSMTGKKGLFKRNLDDIGSDALHFMKYCFTFVESISSIIFLDFLSDLGFAEVDGIYRVSGLQSRILELKALFNTSAFFAQITQQLIYRFQSNSKRCGGCSCCFWPSKIVCKRDAEPINPL